MYLIGSNNHTDVKYVEHMRKKGFVLLYAVLVSSLLLSLGLAIFNITIKEIRLSSASRESQFAFYAADTGIECALYWDIQFNAFATSTASNISCAGQDLGSVGGVGYGNPSEFTVDLGPLLPYCAIVSVTKTESPQRTLIESRGYNTCDTSSPRRVERAIRVRF